MMKLRSILPLLLVGLCVDRLSAQVDQSGDFQENHNFQVHISGLKVEITCPKEGPTSLTLASKNKVVSSSKEKHELENYSSDNNGMYSCEDSYLYLHAYVCETCTEVSGMMVVCVVIADCLLTTGACLFVFIFCKRNPDQARESGFAKGANKKGNKERPPPVPNPDYEPIQKRRQDVYDGLNQALK
ncbi:T-cell surface glycoprotein CD3 epsilon chain [Bufo bufo]|uniref:T-cell surface glycoprotein CD3 epsilon chain n=1 Tax=Bufo bufo TaxID=8384 RepID=UPI001ABE68FC|nr:T-cell surface glycoprotein CD3 epsilon chain [Bufo bufo]